MPETKSPCLTKREAVYVADETLWRLGDLASRLQDPELKDLHRQVHARVVERLSTVTSPAVEPDPDFDEEALDVNLDEPDPAEGGAA